MFLLVLPSEDLRLFDSEVLYSLLRNPVVPGFGSGEGRLFEGLGGSPRQLSLKAEHRAAVIASAKQNLSWFSFFEEEPQVFCLFSAVKGRVRRRGLLSVKIRFDWRAADATGNSGDLPWGRCKGGVKSLPNWLSLRGWEVILTHLD